MSVNIPKTTFHLILLPKRPPNLKTNLNLREKQAFQRIVLFHPFCKKGKTVEVTFDRLFASLKTKWIFLSYNSESLVSKNRMCEIMEKYGTVEVVERDYKRFKSFEYNEDKEIKEYLFCLKIRD